MSARAVEDWLRRKEVESYVFLALMLGTENWQKKGEKRNSDYNGWSFLKKVLKFLFLMFILLPSNKKLLECQLIEKGLYTHKPLRYTYTEYVVYNSSHYSRNGAWLWNPLKYTMSVQLAQNFLVRTQCKKNILREKGFEAKTTLPYLSILYKTFFKKEAEKSVFFY